MTTRRRLDVELVRRGLVESREQAQREISHRRVLVGGAFADKAARLVDPGDDIRLLGPGPRFVSRAGDKLDAALDHFEIDPTGLVALDVGSSTGGFTDCLLQRGAARVHASSTSGCCRIPGSTPDSRPTSARSPSTTSDDGST